MAAPAEPSQSTAALQLPYPAQSQPPGSGYHYMRRLAERVEKFVVGVYATASARDVAVPAPQKGTMAYTQDQGIFWVRGTNTWEQVYPASGPKVTKGSANPSGGSDGDVYFKYV